MAADEYRDLMVEAREALRELLQQTEPGVGISLHVAYADLGQMIGAHDRAASEQERDTAREARYATQSARRNVWLRCPRIERQHRILNVLGDERLTVRELTRRMRDTCTDIDVFEPDVRRVVGELLSQGQVDRRQEPCPSGGRAKRWRYFRRTTSNAQIEALERALDQTESEA